MRLAGVVALALLAGCTRTPRLTSAAAPAAVPGPASPRPSAAETAIRAARERSNRAIAAHDTAAIAAEWMPDLSVVTSAGMQLRGREENARAFAQQFRALGDVWYRREPDSVSVWEPWGMAAEHGRWRGGWTQADEKVELRGEYFAKWQLRDGKWLIQAEIYVPGWCRGSAYCARRPGS